MSFDWREYLALATELAAAEIDIGSNWALAVSFI
jgi:hypothetical protein